MALSLQIHHSSAMSGSLGIKLQQQQRVTASCTWECLLVSSQPFPGLLNKKSGWFGGGTCTFGKNTTVKKIRSISSMNLIDFRNSCYSISTCSVLTVVLAPLNLCCKESEHHSWHPYLAERKRPHHLSDKAHLECLLQSEYGTSCVS